MCELFLPSLLIAALAFQYLFLVLLFSAVVVAVVVVVVSAFPELLLVL